MRPSAILSSIFSGLPSARTLARFLAAAQKAVRLKGQVTVLLTTAFLMRYFRRNDDMSLDPFGYYCIIAGIASIALLVFQ